MKKALMLLLAVIFCFCFVLLGTHAEAAEKWPTADYSGSITTGGTFQTISLPGTRRSIEFQNICSVSGKCTTTSNLCHLFFGSGSPSTDKSIVVQAGQGYLRSSGVIPSDTLKLTCAGTGDKFVLKIQ